MQITIVGQHPMLLSIRLPRPFRLGFGTLSTLPRILVFLEARVEGVSHILQGVGEAAIDFPFAAYDTLDIWNALQAIDLRGMEISSAWDRLLLYEREAQQTVVCYAAIAALNMALDDIEGKARGIPVYALYGLQRRSGVILESVGVQANMADLSFALCTIYRRGRVPKLKLNADLEYALSAIRAASKAARSYCSGFMTDCNASLSFSAWQELLKRIADFSIFEHWDDAEQPTTVTEGVSGLIAAAALSRQHGGPTLIADESFLTEADAVVLAQAGIVLNMKIQKVGGIRRAFRLYESCAGAVPIMVGGTFPTALGRAYDMHAAACLPSSLEMPCDAWQPSIDWFSGDDHLIEESFLWDDTTGRSQVFTGSGLGITPNTEKIALHVVRNAPLELRRFRRTGHGQYFTYVSDDGSSYAEAYTRHTGRPAHPTLSTGGMNYEDSD